MEIDTVKFICRLAVLGGKGEEEERQRWGERGGGRERGAGRGGEYVCGGRGEVDCEKRI